MSKKNSQSILYKHIRFNNLSDERGNLIVIEGNKDIPFKISRIFYIYGTDPLQKRGQHANRNSEFVFINIAGKSKIMVTDGIHKETLELTSPDEAIYIPKMIWKEMYDFSEDSVLLCISNCPYDKSEYIRNFEEYIALMKNK